MSTSRLLISALAVIVLVSTMLLGCTLDDGKACDADASQPCRCGTSSWGVATCEGETSTWGPCVCGGTTTDTSEPAVDTVDEVACVPSCVGKECGPDDCGGTCGACTGDDSCVAGACVAPATMPCETIDYCPEGLSYEGCCDNGRLYFCNDGSMMCSDCTEAGSTCGWSSEGGWYDCSSIGQGPPEFPMECPWATACVPDCIGKMCGDDGCGGSCGSCSVEGACQDGYCYEDEPDCTGKECGDDGLGGSCGACPEGEECSSAGICETTPGGFGAPCSSPGDCMSGICIPVGGGSFICTELCTDECPQGYACDFFTLPTGDGYYACAPDEP